jgi:signal transduction histidine kinase
MLESGIISEELQGREIDNATFRTVAEQIASTQSGGARNIMLHDRLGSRIYPLLKTQWDDEIKLQPIIAGQTRYHVVKEEDRYTIYITGLFPFGGVPLYLSYIRDISDVFHQRDKQLNDFILYDITIVVASAAALFLLSWLLTRPIRRLSAVSRRIAGGEYGERAHVRSSDEIGELTENFNRMADSVQEKIGELEESSRRKDEFIANFTHELKTPMTSIIGYADMLRSRDCDSQTVFKAANFIFNEGKRLESLSLKMLDLLMLDKQALALKPMDGPALLEYVADAMSTAFTQDGIALCVTTCAGLVLAEPDMIKTLLINLADNARKASSRGSTVEIAGRIEGARYEITVTDHGRGIPESELGRITEAFYMVDKSRARAQHGAGLGLAIASRIAELHNAQLSIRSIMGVGTSVGIGLKVLESPEGSGEDEE